MRGNGPLEDRGGAQACLLGNPSNRPTKRDSQFVQWVGNQILLCASGLSVPKHRMINTILRPLKPKMPEAISPLCQWGKHHSHPPWWYHLVSCLSWWLSNLFRLIFWHCWHCFNDTSDNRTEKIATSYIVDNNLGRMSRGCEKLEIKNYWNIRIRCKLWDMSEAGWWYLSSHAEHGRTRRDP